MTDRERNQYKRRYLKLTREIDNLAAPYNCGLTLASFINPRIGILQQELEELVSEIKEKI